MGHVRGRDFLSDSWDYPWKLQLPAGAGVRKVTRCLFSTCVCRNCNNIGCYRG